MDSNVQNALKLLYQIKDSSFIKQRYSAPLLASIEGEWTKNTLIYVGGLSSMFTIQNNFQILISACKMSFLQGGVVWDEFDGEFSKYSVNLNISKARDQFNGLQVSFVNYGGKDGIDYDSSLYYQVIEQDNSNVKEQVQEPHRKIQIAVSDLNDYQFALQDYFQGYNIDYTIDVKQSHLSQFITLKNDTITPYVINFNVSTSNRFLKSHFYLDGRYIVTFDSSSNINIYDMLNTATQFTSTYSLAKEDAKFNLLYTGLDFNSTQTMIFFGQQLNQSKRLIKLNVMPGKQTSPVIFQTFINSTVDYISAIHACYCYCNGGQYTVVVQDNVYDQFNNPVHIYRPILQNSTYVDEVVILDAKYFHLPTFQTAYVKVHQRFPILFIGLIDYGIIGIDLATMHLIVDIEFNNFIPDAEGRKLTSFIIYNETNIIVSFQAIGNIIFEIPELNKQYYDKFVKSLVNMRQWDALPLTKNSTKFYMLPSYASADIGTYSFIGNEYSAVLLGKDSSNQDKKGVGLTAYVFDLSGHKKSLISKSIRIQNGNYFPDNCLNLAYMDIGNTNIYKRSLHEGEFSVLCDNQIYQYRFSYFTTLQIQSTKFANKIKQQENPIKFSISATSNNRPQSLIQLKIEMQVNRKEYKISTLSLLISLMMILCVFVFLMYFCRKKKYIPPPSNSSFYEDGEEDTIDQLELKLDGWNKSSTVFFSEGQGSSMRYADNFTMVSIDETNSHLRGRDSLETRRFNFSNKNAKTKNKKQKKKKKKTSYKSTDEEYLLQQNDSHDMNYLVGIQSKSNASQQGNFLDQNDK